jgi:hypothetical protein
MAAVAFTLYKNIAFMKAACFRKARTAIQDPTLRGARIWLTSGGGTRHLLLTKNEGKGKAILVTGRGDPEDCVTLRLPLF